MTTNPTLKSQSASVAGPGVSQQSEAQRTIDLIRAPGKLYENAYSINDPVKFAVTAAQEFDILKKSSTFRQGMTDFEYMQALVRQSGMSNGTGPLGMSDPADIKAFQKVLQSAYLDGITWDSWLTKSMQNSYTSAGKGPVYSKDISTALKLIDKTDAESILSDTYYKAFNVYPTSALIEKFKTSYNAEAQRQLATTTTSGVKTAGIDSSVSKTKQVESGQGFTQAEQESYIAGFLKDNYKITGEEQGGQVKAIIDDIKKVYANNLLPEPPINEIISFAADVIGTANADVYKQKIDTKLQSVRLTAAKMYPGMADQLTAGVDLNTYADPVVQMFNTNLGTNITKKDPRIAKVLNYNDGKTVRPMNATELQNFIETQPEFQTSDAGRTKYMALGQAFKDGLG